MKYLQISLNTSDKLAPFYEDILFDLGALSVTFIDTQDNPIFEPQLGSTPLWDFTTILALFDLEQKDEVLQNLNRLSIENNITFEYQELPEKDWEREWLKYFKPLSFGDRLWVIPTGFSDMAGKVNLHLDPGLAFGTGTHPTTFLCLNYLDNAKLDNKTVLDFGCGSGILAVASLLLGAKKAVAVDIDEQALQATKQNAIKNNIDLSKINIDFPNVSGQFDLVLANILAQPLMDLSQTLINAVTTGGVLVLSGILTEQIPQVSSFYQNDFAFKITEKDGWASLIGVKK
jgi:ribosomal protein L11 methyltransferase